MPDGWVLVPVFRPRGGSSSCRGSFECFCCLLFLAIIGIFIYSTIGYYHCLTGSGDGCPDLPEWLQLEPLIFIILLVSLLIMMCICKKGKISGVVAYSFMAIIVIQVGVSGYFLTYPPGGGDDGFTEDLLYYLLGGVCAVGTLIGVCGICCSVFSRGGGSYSAFWICSYNDPFEKLNTYIIWFFIANDKNDMLCLKCGGFTMHYWIA